MNVSHQCLLQFAVMRGTIANGQIAIKQKVIE